MTPARVVIDFQQEFARYMRFVSAVAGEILSNNPLHNPAAGQNVQAVADSRWLAEVLHNFEMLSEAIAAGDAQEIAFVVNAHLRRFEEYRPVGLADPHHGKHRVFERNGGVDLLEEGVSILSAIRLKAHEALGAAGPALHPHPVAHLRAPAR